MTAPAVIVITGIMAAGKSTVAQLLAERLPKAAHVRGDVFRRMIVSGREEMTPEQPPEAVAQLRLRYEQAAAAADRYAAAGFTAIMQDVILGSHLADVMKMVTTTPKYAVVLAPSPAAVAAREAARAKTGYGDWTPEMLDAGFRQDTPELGLWLDTSDLTAEDTVSTILHRLPEARMD